MLAFFLRRTRDAELAADLTAEVFAAVLLGCRRYRPGAAPAARCVDPLTGRTLATLPDVVAAEGSTAYVQREVRGVPEIHLQTLDPRCLAGH